ncbi:scaffold attachment factor B2-like [Strongylocentrotus purpuratus]|uniref:Uncharacterized protein n=1 Tax=Strongylocentrotus purpuratus TaxID=7668 RepID=A0A7M7NE54_STRPU|nr:scaffold attachment factor B2-like [Strongylocentrotus purpuratus]
MKPPATSPAGKSPAKPGEEKPTITTEPGSEVDTTAQPDSKEKTDKDKEKDKKDILSFGEAEREMREAERRRERGRSDQFRRQRDLRRRTREEEEDKVSRELEQQLKILQIKLIRHRIEREHRAAVKRTMDARGMPMHEMDAYMGEQKRRMETGLTEQQGERNLLGERNPQEEKNPLADQNLGREFPKKRCQRNQRA